MSDRMTVEADSFVMTIIAKLAKEKLREIEDLNEVQSDLEAEDEGWPDDSDSEEAAEDSEDGDDSEEDSEEQEADNSEEGESDESDLIGINEAEELLKPLGINKKMIYYRIETGKMPLPEKINGRFFWQKKELQEWAENLSNQRVSQKIHH